jgi:DNA-binding CsgD family transcriptional regulator
MKSKQLSQREAQVLQLVAQGATHKSIAHELGIKPYTVKNHMGNIYAKLGVNSRVAAVMRAIRQGAIELPDARS